MITLPDTEVLLSSLRCGKCPSCGDRKRPNTSLCFKCFYAIPVDMRHALYRRFGEGYEEAIAEAITHVGNSEQHWPNPKPDGRKR
jgi:ribosomal protein L32